MLTEAEREAIVKSGLVYLHSGLKAGLAGWKNEDYCGVHSAMPGFWACRWETAQEVVNRPDRRFQMGELRMVSPGGWFGLPLTRSEYETEEDYQRALARGEAEIAFDMN